MGKGSCLCGLCDFAEMGLGAIRCMVGCLCCLTCMGPILLIVGIVTLLVPNNYEAHVKEYDAVLANYTDRTVPLIKKTKLDFPTAKASIPYTVGTVSPTGNIKHVHPVDAYSYHWTTGKQLYSLTATDLMVTVNGAGFAPAGAAPAETTTTFYVAGAQAGDTSVHHHTVRVQCDSSYCTPSEIRWKCAQQVPSSHSHLGCTERDMVYYGGTIYGRSHRSSSRSRSSSSFSIGGHRDRDFAICDYYTRVESYCQPLELQQQGKGFFKWVKSPTLTSCDFPFTSQKRTCSSNPVQTAADLLVPFRFLASDDPHIELSRITSGSMSFGLTARQQRLIGIGLLLLGAFMMVCIIGGCVAICRPGNRRHKAAAYGALGREYSDSPQGPDHQPVGNPDYAQPAGQYGGSPNCGQVETLPPPPPYDNQPPPGGYTPGSYDPLVKKGQPPPQYGTLQNDGSVDVPRKKIKKNCVLM